MKGWNKYVEELKPCPFCGGKVEIRSKLVMHNETFWILCTKCHMWYDKYMWGGMGVENVAEEWNRRVSE